MAEPGPSPDTHRSRWEVFLPVLGLALFGLALFVIRHQLSEESYIQIRQALAALPTGKAVLALLLTAASFSVLTTYDALGVRYAGHSLSRGKTAFASFVGYAFSQALGSPLLTGAGVRYRLYSAWDLSAVEITRVVGFCAVTTWVGLLTVAGTAFLLEPASLAAVVPAGAPVRVLGATAVALVAAYALWTAKRPRALRVFAWEFPVPPPRLAWGQVIAGALDWVTAASVLFVLLPAGHGISFVQVVGAFAVAQVLGLASLVPGGLGVFEATLLVLLGDRVPGAELVASLVAYRGIYFLLPLFVAAPSLGVFELRQKSAAVEKALGSFGRGISAVTPLALATMVFVAGGLLLLTGSLPLPEGRLARIAGALPLPALELSHFLGSLTGAGLLVLAWGLRQRLTVAYRLTLLLLAAGALLSVTRGDGWIPALTLTVAFAALVPARREFFRPSSLSSEMPSLRWTVLVAWTLAGSIWLGFFVYRRVDLSSELWWQFALQGDAPRFLRATLGATVLLLALGLVRLLRPAAPERAEGPGRIHPSEVDAVVASADRAHAALVYLGDKSVLLSESRRAFVMYGVEGRSWVSLGDPVGDPLDHDELVWSFRALAHRYGGRPVFYQVRPDHLPLYVDAGLAFLKLGEEALVPLEGGFSLEGSSKKRFRQTVRKVEEAGGSFELVPAAEVRALLPELRRVSDAWLAEKSAREKGFSLGFFSEDYLLHTPVAVLRQGDRIAAFVNLLAGGTRKEISADLMRFLPDAPRSSMEYLFIRSLQWAGENGYQRFSLGMAPLSGLESRPLAPLWNRLGAALFRYGEHFYNFQGLRAYKEKFDPVWEPRYLASPGGLALPRVLANLATLIGGGVRGVFRG